jgi:zinc protease
MIQFKEHRLSNGLRLIIHEDHSTPLAGVNILYDVGSRDEEPNKTGFAHLFEHLMFGGSEHISVFDEPLQQAGGENNAFTSTDITNYYETLPAKNIETAFWLESDRMNQLAFNKHSLDIQRKVVSEEFKEHYINQPYGDVWHKLRALAYKQHSYQWPTIGKELKHIEEAHLDDVKNFFFTYYRPNNAILVVGGNVSESEVFSLAEKWFGEIPAGNTPLRSIPKEPRQTEARSLTLEGNVPLDALYKAWHIPARHDPNYYTIDIITELLAGGHSSRLYQTLVKEKKLFSEINAYHTGSIDPGLLVIEGKLVKGISMPQAEEAVLQEIQLLKDQLVDEHELTKVKNRVEAQFIYSEIELLNKIVNLAFATLLGNTNLVNEEAAYYQQVSTGQILDQSREWLVPENSSTIYYLSDGNKG